MFEPAGRVFVPAAEQRARFGSQVPAAFSVARDEPHARQDSDAVAAIDAEETGRSSPRDNADEATFGHRARRPCLRRLLRRAGDCLERAKPRFRIAGLGPEGRSLDVERVCICHAATPLLAAPERAMRSRAQTSAPRRMAAVTGEPSR